MAEEKSNIKQEFNKAVTGLNLDGSQNNIKKGALTYALNAAVENYDSNSVNYQNEPGNEACFDFPDGYKLVGRHLIPEQNKVIFFLANPSSGGSEIGYMINNDCIYHTLVNADCLNFSIYDPIMSIVHKITNFGTEIYWPDQNGRRYLDIDNIPWLPVNASEICDPEDSNQLDCNKLLLLPDISIPITSVVNTISGGELKSGTYQFTVQYADAVGNPYTSFFNVTNPTPIADVFTATVNFDLPVGKSIVVNVDNLEPLGQYQYFNLAVVATVNNISTPYLVGTYFIDDTSKEIIYTGQNVTEIQLSMNDIFEKFAFYDKADHVTNVQDILVWKGVTAVERLDYQKIANQIKLQWQTWRFPAGQGYNIEEKAANFRGYLRDEVYAFEIVFILKNGKETDGFHIPGKKKSNVELGLPAIPSTNPDFIGTPDEDGTSPYWKIYNTATVESFSPEYSPDEDYEGPYQYGEFAYWESSETYPCNENIWGENANQPIRHHKFPDVNISPIIESDPASGNAGLVMKDTAIFPIGVKIDSANVQDLIQRSDLTAAQKADIVGYKIVRADRGVNKSIVAKGMLRNVGEYTKDDQKFFYPNYPYNDVTEDPFLNAINNAWSEQCEPFTIAAFQLTSRHPLTNEPCIIVEYTSCENNKKAVKYITEIGVQEDLLCSLTKPVIVSPGISNNIYYEYSNSSAANFEIRDTTMGYVSYANYDIWEIGTRYNGSDGCSLGYPALQIEWADATYGDATTLAGNGQGGWFPECNYYRYVRLRPGALDPAIISGSSAAANIRFVRTVTAEGCSKEEPLPAIEQEEKEYYRQILNSPETSFGQPFLGNILKLESVMFGAGKAHHVEVKDNARYRLITALAQRDALKTAQRVADLTQTFNLQAMFAVYNAIITTYRNEITKRNFARSFNSIASYNYSVGVPDNYGIKQRNLDIKRYLIPEVVNVGENDININNWQRETSVYLRTWFDDETPGLPLPHESRNMIGSEIYDKSRFTIEEVGNCDKPEREEHISVVSYYGSLKNEFINQYGQVYSYEAVDTGFVKIFKEEEDSTEDFIWGGDTFIGKFAYKTKLPFFFDNRVGFPDDSDIFYDEIGNVAYPKYWHSARSIFENWQSEVDTDLRFDNFISYKAHNFDCPNDQGDPDAEGDDLSLYPDRTFYDGYFYLFAYGIPSFYCESSYNLDLRTAFNNKEGDFWPHVSTGIPDNWVQENNVTIAWDNTYNYNVTYSKQNKESVITNLPADWGDEENREVYPFRAIYSDKQNTDADNRVNNWLTYRPTSYFDFPQNYGTLTAIEGLKNSAILARFENKSLLYNNLLTIDTSNPQAAYVGNSQLFAGAPPLDFAETDLGYFGSQHKFILKTPYGAVTIDAKRGHVFILNGTEYKDLTMFGSGMQRWFTAHLPFEILKYYPDAEIDNHYNGIGLHGVFDSNYERIIITKIDYVPLDNRIVYRNGRWFITETVTEKEIFLNDPDYFCNVSWTISFNFSTNSWISWHSYVPNFYIGENNIYYSGLNSCPNDFDAIVGILDTTIPTTTSTTTIRPSTTTTTSTTAIPYDCIFEVDVTSPDCTLAGTAVAVDAPAEKLCVRAKGLIKSYAFSGYELITPPTVVDSSGSSVAACTHLNYFINHLGDSNYVPTKIPIEYEYLKRGEPLYYDYDVTDCTKIPDGWYVIPDLSATDRVVQVVNGYIQQIISCNTVITTTTTTTV